MSSPQDALEYARRFVGELPIDDAKIKLRILDDAHMKLWMAAPWRWSVGSVDPTPLVNDQQEYNVTTITDLLYLIHATITNGQEKHDLVVSSTLPVTTVLKGRPTQVQYVTAPAHKLRFLPVPTGYGASTPTVLGVYKKTATAITAGNLAQDYSLLGVPKEWFWVYQEIVLMKAYQFSNDPRLGAAGVDTRGVVYSGQHGVVEAAIAEMKQAEKKFFDSLGMPVSGG